MVDKEINKYDKRLRYNLEQWKNKSTSDIMNNISDNFKLVQLMNLLGNTNHALSVVGKWIFDYNYEKYYHWIEFVLGPMKIKSSHSLTNFFMQWVMSIQKQRKFVYFYEYTLYIYEGLVFVTKRESWISKNEKIHNDTQ